MNKLRELRVHRGWSQFELAKRSSISPADISKMETGTTKAFPGWRKRLAEALGLPDAEIFPEVTDDDRKSNVNG